MKCSAVVLTILFCAVSFGQDSEKVSSKSKNEDDDDRWTWGFVDENTKINKTENRNEGQEGSSTESPSYDDPCLDYNPPKPDFSAPGRKLSDEKCEEYNWDKLFQEELERRAQECWDKKNKDKPRPPAAVGGRPTYAGEFPHMGAIGWKAVVGDYDFKCGGTLISSKFVLTAAHCSKASTRDTSLADPVPKIVRLNDKNLYHKNDEGFYLSQDVNITRIIVHPEYKPPKKYFDIALIELEIEVSFTRLMQPACLWTKRDLTELGSDATLTGWGVLYQGSHDLSAELQAAVVNLINSSYCDQLLHSSRNRNWWGLQENQLCAGKLAGGVDACQGDSGGPLQVKQPIAGSKRESMYYVIGVTSFGIGCALPNVPGIYTRVSSFIPWIESIVWPPA